MKKYERLRSVVLKGFLSALISSLPLSAGAANSSYLLGPQDQIQIKVHDWRAGAAEAHGWAAFDGDIVVDSEGFVSLPIIGRVAASGKSIESLAAEIASSMQLKVGLAELPTASVQVTKYRPFYIVGSIEKPGEYEFRPHLNVLQAFSIAGGGYRAPNNSMFRVERDKIDRRGEISLLDTEETTLLIHQARLETELSGGSKIVLPASLSNRSLSASDQKSVNVEQNILDERKNVLESQIKSITDTKGSIAAEIEGLTKKEASIERQIDLSQKDLTLIKDLLSKGLAVSTRQLSADQNLTALENSKLDMQVAKYRAVQETGKLSREIIDLRSKMKQEALAELSRTRQRLTEIGEKRTAAIKALANANAEENSFGGTEIIRKFFISRPTGNNNVRRFEAKNTDSIEPGDVLEVEQLNSSVQPRTQDRMSLNEANKSSLNDRQ